MDPVPGARFVQLAALIQPRSWAATDVTRLADGAYVVCGVDYFGDDYWWGYGNMSAIRISVDGWLDPSFGHNGFWQIEPDESGYSWAIDCDVSADGSIFAAGYQGDHPALLKVRPDGVTDTAAWAAGILELDFYGTASSVVELTDGDFALLGTNYDLGIQFIARVDSTTGTFDAAFGTDGVTTLDFGRSDERPWTTPAGLMAQADGKLVAVSALHYSGVEQARNVNRGDALGVARIDPNGTGNNGFVGFASLLNQVTEGSGSEVAVSVQRTGGSTGLFVVSHETRAQSAGEDDFRPTTGTLVWPDGDSGTKQINVRIAADALLEPTESFQIALFDSTGSLAQSVTTVAIQDFPTFPKPPVYTEGGGSGAFGIEVILLLILGCYRLIPLRKVRRTCMLVPLAVLAAAGAARAQTEGRDRTWDLGLSFADSDDVTVSGPAGTSISFMASSGWGLWGDFNFSNRLAIGFEWSQLSPDAETNFSQDLDASGVGTLTTIRHQADIDNLHIKGILNFLDRNITPYVEFGIGRTNIDSNVAVAEASGLDPLWVDWYDPWWGHVGHPTAVPGEYEDSNTTYIFAIGVRWDISDRFTARADYAALEGLEVSAVTGTLEPESVRLGFGWRF
jgi:hypothetical protein